MKKIVFAVTIIGLSIFLVNCHGPKQAVASTPNALTYEGDVKEVIAQNCTPCHIPANGGRVRPYDNFANVNTDIDEILRRIQLNPGDRGFMPFKHPKLPDSTIAIFVKWKEQGKLEK